MKNHAELSIEIKEDINNSARAGAVEDCIRLKLAAHANGKKVRNYHAK